MWAMTGRLECVSIRDDTGGGGRGEVVGDEPGKEDWGPDCSGLQSPSGD